MKANIDVKRISYDEAIELYKTKDILELGALANSIRKIKHPENIVSYVIDRNINYTNICCCKCKFCAFYRDIKSDEAYLINEEELSAKIEETLSLNGTQVLLQGGLHPTLKIEYYEDLLRFMKKYPIWLHAFSPPEIFHIALVSKLSIKETISRLVKAGLDSIPGGGAEILDDDSRNEVSPNKITSEEWLGVMEEAHSQGLKTTSTMMFRKMDSAEVIIGHLDKLRELQDKTGGFTAFIPWPFQTGNSEIDDEEVTALEYLKVLAISRIYLDNIDNIQVSWVTQGDKIGQLGLLYGGNDFGSVMIEENVVKAAGADFRLNTEEIRYLISAAGFIPRQRNMQYELIG